MTYVPSNIVTVPPGNFTPGAQASLDFAAAVINAAWNQANIKFDDFETRMAAINAELAAMLANGTAPHITAGSVAAPSIVEPPVDIPATQSADDIYQDFATEYAKIIAELSARFVAFREEYFPDESAAYTAAEDWLQAAIVSQTGLPSGVAAQMLTDDKDRILSEADRATETVLATFAARRFPLPPGPAAAAISEITSKAQDDIAISSRKIVITSIDHLHWVVEKTLGLRQMSMAAAIDYIKALASGPDIASRLVNVGYDAQSKLISAASQFYNSRTAAAELTAKVGQFNEQIELQAAEKNQAADLTILEDRLKALLAECQALATMATSMFNNLHASAGTSYSGSEASNV